MHIGFALHDPRFAFWAILSHAAQERATELHTTLTVIPSSSPAEQAAAIERLVDQRVDALIVGPIDSHALVSAVQRATAAGIPVVAADTEISGCQVACTVRSDNVGGTELVAAYVFERNAEHIAVAHLQGPQSAQSGAQRSEGLHNALRARPGAQLVFEASGDWTRESGRRLIREALAAHPEIRAVFAANDPMAMGAIDAIEEAGRAGQIMVAGFDALSDALIAIHKGSMAATVRQAPREIGREVVQIALRAARGEPVPPLVEIETSLITPDNLIEAALDALDLMPGILRDVVDSGTALEKERALLRTVLDALPDTHAFVKDRSSRFVITNAAHLKTLGVERLEQVVGKTDLDFFPQDLAAQYQADEQAIMESGQALYDRIEPVVDQAGNHKWYLTSKVPLRDANGKVVGLVGMSRDISALKQAEQDRTRLQEEIIRAQDAALQELSTPLIPINDQVMIMPLIGALDARRTQLILQTLLEGISASGAEIAILDITGVPLVDTHVANALIQAAQAVSLLGAKVVLTGIRPEVAQTLVGLGVDLKGIVTSSTLQSGVAYALRRQK
jgi:PAS domain S-box-containing protein